MRLSSEQKKMLIQIAMDEVHRHLIPEGKKRKQEKIIPEALRAKCGAFVSLYVGKQLRGCIGTFSEDEPLYKNIRKMTLSAATLDTRFSPIKAEEIGQLRIEISVLSPRVPIGGQDEIEIGKHGIYMELGSNRGTLLPQVALDQHWTVEEFLGNCAKHKAGLDWDGWKSARLFTYEATVFDSGEDEGIVKKY